MTWDCSLTIGPHLASLVCLRMELCFGLEHQQCADDPVVAERARSGGYSPSLGTRLRR
jgi:hypothetical protein